MEWIDIGVVRTGEWVLGIMNPGVLRNLIVEGIIAGVGAVVIFLPQILNSLKTKVQSDKKVNLKFNLQFTDLQFEM